MNTHFANFCCVWRFVLYPTQSGVEVFFTLENEDPNFEGRAPAPKVWGRDYALEGPDLTEAM